MKLVLFLSVFTFAGLTQAKDKTPSHCDLYFKKEKVCGSLTWVKKPVVVTAPTAKDAAAFDVQLWSFSKGPASSVNLDNGKSLFISLYMPSMGHGSEPVILTKDEKSAGLYHATQVLFSMEGAWEIRAMIKQNDKKIDSANLPFEFK